jgi:hypothetical protein
MYGTCNTYEGAIENSYTVYRLGHTGIDGRITGCEGRDCIQVAQDRMKWCTSVDYVCETFFFLLRREINDKMEQQERS